MTSPTEAVERERTQFEDAYLTFGSRAGEAVALMRDVKGEYLCNETKDSWHSWQFARGVFEVADAYKDWVSKIVVHVNECDTTLVTLEGHYEVFEYALKDCSSVEQGQAFKAKLDEFLATQPGRRAALPAVTAELSKL